MRDALSLCLILAAVAVCAPVAWSQELEESTAEEAAREAVQGDSDEIAQPTAQQDSDDPVSQNEESDLEEKVEETVESARKTTDAIAEAVDKSEQAQEASAGVLKPIYRLAESFSFPAFHWIAFAVMVTGVVSFALQLTIGKLIVLSKLGFSLSEILSDALGLIVSLVGLVLTTQAATENSNFTQSAVAVLSATLVGALVGFVFYLWGQKQELHAVAGRRSAAAANAMKK